MNNQENKLQANPEIVIEDLAQEIARLTQEKAMWKSIALDLQNKKEEYKKEEAKKEEAKG